MSMLKTFDLESDYTIFFIGVLVLMVAFWIALSRASADRFKSKRGRRAKINDRVTDRTGELID